MSCRRALLTYLAIGAFLAMPMENAEAGLMTSLDEGLISAIDVSHHSKGPQKALRNSYWLIPRFCRSFSGLSQSFNPGISTTPSNSSSNATNVSPIAVEEALLVTGLPFSGWVDSQASLLANAPDPLLLFRPPRA
jgi:hypothetical protein